MANIIVSYDLNSPGKDYSRLISAIRQLGSTACFRVQLSTWFLSSHKSAADVRNALTPFLDRNDTLLVVDASKDAAAWSGPLENGDKLRANWGRTY